MKDVRVKALSDWARAVAPGESLPADASLTPVSDDASFRRYFRFDRGAEGLVFVDAPPEHEDNPSFVMIAGALKSQGLVCPEVFAVDYDQGFLVISDLGDTVYQDVILTQPERIEALYDDALNALLTMMDVQCDLPAYDQTRLLAEMSLFDDWFLDRQLGIELDAATREMLQQAYHFLIDSALSQPSVFVHRDYHCRNLMVQTCGGPGIIDFQDAVNGPVTYDLVSLFKDCYHRFDREYVVAQVLRFTDLLESSGRLPAGAPVLRWFDLMGAQRHLKCAGIFSRLNLRDGKPDYLHDIPLVVSYLDEVCGLYSELGALRRLLQDQVIPRLSESPFNQAFPGRSN